MSQSLTHTVCEPPKVTFSSAFINSLGDTRTIEWLLMYTVIARDSAYDFFETPSEKHGLESLNSVAIDALKYEVRLEKVPQMKFKPESISRTNRTGMEYSGEIIVKLESFTEDPTVEVNCAPSAEEFVKSATIYFCEHNVLEDARNAYLETENGLVELYELVVLLLEEREAKRHKEEAKIVELPLIDLSSKRRHNYFLEQLPMQQDVY